MASHPLLYFHLLAFVVHSTNTIIFANIGITSGEVKPDIVNYVSTGISKEGIEMSETVIFSGVSITSIVMVNELITAVSHGGAFLGFFCYQRVMLMDDKHTEVVRRYLEYSITAGFLEAALYLSTKNNFNELLAIIVTNVVLQIIGYMSERTDLIMRKVYHFLSGIILLIIPISYIITGAASLDENSAMLVAVMYTILYLLFGIHNILGINEEYSKYIDKDVGFTILSIVTKTVLSWMVVVWQRKHFKMNDIEVTPDISSHIDFDNFLMWMPLGSIFAAIVLFVYASTLDTSCGEYEKGIMCKSDGPAVGIFPLPVKSV